MAVPVAGARFRQRKISTKQTLQILKQAHVPDIDLEDIQRDTQKVDTGVEKGEEEEHHLQAVINATQAKFQGENVEQVFIPTPDASRVWADSAKYYPAGFISPSLNIKFSCTVEESSGCPYNMDEADETFLHSMNATLQRKNPQMTGCTEAEFELLCHRFDSVIADKQPFLSMAPDHIMLYAEIKAVATPTLLPEMLKEELHLSSFVTTLDVPTPAPRALAALLEVFGAKVYEHWKSRRLARGGKPVFPVLKVEEPEKDDDPYVCFRRREVRQARKTRRQDQQSSERLRALQTELRHARAMVLLVAKRELKRQELLEQERAIFALRCAIKPVKRALMLKGDDDDLVAHKKKKVVEEPAKKKSAPVPAPVPEEPQPYVRLPASKIPDLDLLLTVSAVLREKNEAIKRAVHEKLQKRKEADRGFVNFTDDPYVPWFTLKETEPIAEYSHVPFSAIVNGLYSISLSEYLDDRDATGVTTFQWDGSETSAGCEGVNPLTERMPWTPRVSDPLYVLRKRVGRGGREFVDRRGLFERVEQEVVAGEEGVNVYDSKGDAARRLNDRWKFDSDFDDCLFSSDPAKLNGISNDTQSIRFGSMLLAKSYEQLREATQQKQQRMMRQATAGVALAAAVPAGGAATGAAGSAAAGPPVPAAPGRVAPPNGRPAPASPSSRIGPPGVAPTPNTPPLNANLTPQQILSQKPPYSPSKLTPEQHQRLAMLKSMQRVNGIGS